MASYTKVSRDTNHAEICKALKDAGHTVLDLAAVGKGCPDILVGVKTKSKKRINIFLEIKSSPTAQVTQDQKDFRLFWHGQYAIVYSAEQAITYCDYYRDFEEK
jgi:hypothetical protein